MFKSIFYSNDRTNSVSAMHEDDTPELNEVATILKHLGVNVYAIPQLSKTNE